MAFVFLSVGAILCSAGRMHSIELADGSFTFTCCSEFVDLVHVEE